MVLPGTYYERVQFKGADMTVRSAEGPERTVIDGSQTGLGTVWINRGEGPDFTLDGFTISGGTGGEAGVQGNTGGGLFIRGSSPTIRNCVIRNNRNPSGNGGGAYVLEGNPTFLNCHFLGNHSDDDGGGAAGGSSHVIFSNCVFAGNSAGRSGGALSFSASTVDCINCTITHNVSRDGSAVRASYGTELTALNSVIWANYGSPILSYGASPLGYVRHCIVAGGYEGAGNLDVAPRFMRAPSPGLHGWDGLDDDYGDLRLRGNSPGVDAGSNDLLPPGVDEDTAGAPRVAGNICSDSGSEVVGATVDIGAYEFQPPPACGDNVCGADESCETCACDCGDCCGNGTCEAFEDCLWCAEDCPCATLSVPDQFATIREAVVAARPGDEVVVQPGVYHEQVDFQGKNLTVQSLDGPAVTTLEGSELDDSIVHFLNNEGPMSVLRGFTLTGGRGKERYSHSRYGGAVYVLYGGPTLSDCVFTENSADFGGAVYSDRSGVRLIRSKFASNSAGSGGAVYEFVGSMTISHCEFVDNTAWFFGGAMYTNRSPSILKSRFARNHSETGGAIYSEGSGSEPLIDGSTFEYNSATESGGAVSSSSGLLTVVNSTFLGNASPKGGGITNEQGGQLEVVGSVLVGNVTNSSWGAAIADNGSDVTIVNSSIVGNQAPLIVGGIRTNGRLHVTNSIVRGNSFEQIAWLGLTGGVVVSHSNVAGGFDGEMNFDADAQFVRSPYDGGDGWGDDTDTPDVDEGANDDFGDVRLRSDSPCIDAGDNDAIAGFDFDLDGNPRIYNDVVDMGAYEFIPPPMEVDITVHPRGRTDLLELHDHGHLPVSVLSSESFDALTIDPATVKLSGASVVRRGKSGQYLVQKQDINRDGRTDLVLYFDQVDVAPDGNVVTLTGTTYDGTQIVGSDTIKTRQHGRGG